MRRRDEWLGILFRGKVEGDDRDDDEASRSFCAEANWTVFITVFISFRKLKKGIKFLNHGCPIEYIY